ncbi:MAG: response regulator, partial [Bacteroidota bacterium]|nr:response regulator [Bacteroidota bacterium]
MEILIVEDDKLTLNLLQFCIQNLGHKAHLAVNTEEAIEMMKDGKFDLIITDIMMPGVSGLSFVTNLRTVEMN